MVSRFAFKKIEGNLNVQRQVHFFLAFKEINHLKLENNEHLGKKIISAIGFKKKLTQKKP